MNNESIKTGEEIIEQLIPTLLWEHRKQVVWWKRSLAPQRKLMRTVSKATKSDPKAPHHTYSWWEAFSQGRGSTKVLVLSIPTEKGEAPD